MKVHLLYIVPRWADRSEAQQFLLLVARLPREQLDVHACLLGHQPRLEERLLRLQIGVTRIPQRTAWDFSTVRRLRQWLIRSDYDVVHVWNGTLHLASWLAAVTGGARVVVNQDQAAEPRGLAEKWLHDWLARRSRAVVVDSADDCAEATAGAHWQVIPPGVDVPRSEPERHDAAAVGHDPHQALRLAPSTQLIGVVGRLDRRHGIKDAIWAADLLKVVRDDTHLLIFGDGPHRWRMERFRRQTRTEDRVHFLRDCDPSPVIPHLACLWQPQRQSCGVYAAIVALAHGVPVVATDLPCHRRLITDGRTGFLIATGNRAALARRTQWLLQDRTLREQIGRQSRADLQQRFPLTAWLERYQALYLGCR